MQAVLRSNAEEVARIDRLLQTHVLSSLRAPEGRDDAALQQCLALHRDTSHGSTLANLAIRPSPENLHEWPRFREAWQMILKSCKELSA